jgi:hypothetical protein
MKCFIFTSLASLIGLLSCVDSPDFKEKCVKGKYLGTVPYCLGNVIQILDGTNSGKTWTSDGRVYENCFAASLDSVYAKSVSDPFNLKQDSIFYFTYREGGYPRKEYVACQPESFITITQTYLNSCAEEKP